MLQNCRRDNLEGSQKNFGEFLPIRQIRQSFLPPSFSSVQYSERGWPISMENCTAGQRLSQELDQGASCPSERCHRLTRRIKSYSIRLYLLIKTLQ